MSETAETNINISEAAQSYKVTFRSYILPFFVSFVALGLVFYFTYKPNMFSIIAQVFKPSVLMIACAILMFRILTTSYRIQYISHGTLSFKSAFKTQIIWDFYSNITPSVIGGAPFAALYMNKEAGVKVGEASSIMLFAMLLDQVWFALSIPLMLFASFFYEVIPKTFGTAGKGMITIYFLAIMLWVGIFAYSSLIKPQILHRFLSWITSFAFLKRFKPRVDKEMESLAIRAEIIRKQPLRFFVVGLALTFITWLCRYLLLLFVIRSVVDVESNMQVILRAMAVLLSYIVMPTPGGAGGIEFFYAAFFTPLIGEVFVAPTLFVWRLLGFYIFVFIGAFLTTKQLSQVVIPDPVPVPIKND